MPFIKRGVYRRLRFCSQSAAQNYILADVIAVCYSNAPLVGFYRNSWLHGL